MTKPKRPNGTSTKTQQAKKYPQTPPRSESGVLKDGNGPSTETSPRSAPGDIRADNIGHQPLRFQLAKKVERDAFREALVAELNKDTPPDLEALKDTLKDAVDGAVPARNPSFLLANKMQLTALLALEAEFFFAIEGRKARKNYEALHDELFGKESDFTKMLKRFNTKELYKRSSLSYEAVYQTDDLQNSFDNQLKFMEQAKTVFKSSGETQILPTASLKTLESFIANIDPRVLSYAVVCNGSDLSLNYRVKGWGESGIDICHEVIATVRALCCVIVDSAKIALTPSLLSAFFITLVNKVPALTAAIGAGGTLPITAGIAICALHYSALQVIESADLPLMSDQNRRRLQGEITERFDRAFSHDRDSGRGREAWKQPFSLFNVIDLATEIISYLMALFKQKKLEFLRVSPGSLNPMEELVQYSNK